MLWRNKNAAIKKVSANTYDSKVILDSISLDINDGEIVSILGPSGSGKINAFERNFGLTEIDGGQIILTAKT